METSLYLLKWLEMFSLFLIVVGALNWGCVAFLKFNVVEWMEKNSFVGLATIVYALVAISAVVHLFSRDYYLSFLGEAVFPCESMVERIPDGADVSVEVRVAPNVNVVYWAAERSERKSDEVVKDPWIAYKKYANAGVVRSDAQGVAFLKIRSPAAYKTPGLFKRELPKHVHYRECKYPGFMSRVKSVNV
jgi:uncharacterized membrane protein YuzA (DUF378 family)